MFCGWVAHIIPTAFLASEQMRPTWSSLGSGSKTWHKEGRIEIKPNGQGSHLVFGAGLPRYGGAAGGGRR